MSDAALERFAAYARQMGESEQASPNPGHEDRAALWEQINREVRAYMEPAPDALADHPELFA